MRHAVGADRPGAVRRVAEHVGVGAERDSGGERRLGLLDPAGAQQFQRAGADRDPALGPGLGRVAGR